MQHFYHNLNSYYYQNQPYYPQQYAYTYQNNFPMQINYIPQINQFSFLDQIQQSEVINPYTRTERQTKALISEESRETSKILSPVPKTEEIKQKKNEDKKFHEVKLRVKMSEKNIKQSEKVFKNAYLSFIFNKILKFIQNRLESQIFVRSNFEKFHKNDQLIIDQFYKYAQNESNKILNQVSIQKIRDFWINLNLNQPVECNTDQNIQLFHQTFRVLSRIYLADIYINYILRSKKINKERRIHHLRMRRCLLKNLKSPKEFKTYKDF